MLLRIFYCSPHYIQILKKEYYRNYKYNYIALNFLQIYRLWYHRTIEKIIRLLSIEN